MARLPLGAFPTPVERHDVDEGHHVRSLLVKRDDACGPGYAGNKLRKLEFLLADARSCGAQRLITAGATGSHHAFATAYHGRAAGFDVSLVLFPQSLNAHVREMLLLDHAVDAELCWASRMETVPYGVWRARFRHRYDSPYVVPPGGSNDIGTFGFVNAGLELAGQLERGAVERPSSIHVAAGTMGTVVGIAIGLAWAGIEIPIHAIRITSRLLTNERTLALLARATLARLRSAGAAPPDLERVLAPVRMIHDQIGDGYGRTTPAGERAQDLFAAAGIALEPTYTAKAAAALLAGTPESDPLPLFWHTLSGVQPLELIAGMTAADLPSPFDAYAARG